MKQAVPVEASPANPLWTRIADNNLLRLLKAVSKAS